MKAEIRYNIRSDHYVNDRRTQRVFLKIFSNQRWAAKRSRGIDALRARTSHGCEIERAGERSELNVKGAS